MTQFERACDRSITELADTAAIRALDDADVCPDEVTSVHVGNMAAEAFNDRTGLANALAASIGADRASADRVENTSASGASAFTRAVESIQSEASDIALVVGVEKMSGAETTAATNIISRLTHEWEWAHGLTLPSFGGLAAGVYLDRYGVDREALARVSVKNHANAARNPYAQFERAITIADVLDSPPIAEPLRLFDCCPMSDGAAAVVVTAVNDGVRIASTVSAVGTHAVAERDDVLRIESVERAGDRAFERVGLDRSDVDVACIHDAFTILEWIELEELGFYDAGDAWRATVEGETSVDGRFPVNPGGGLKARGHPVGATGVSQLIELVWQLRGDTPGDDRQVRSATTGLALNVAGFGNNAVCSLLEAR